MHALGGGVGPFCMTQLVAMQLYASAAIAFTAAVAIGDYQMK